MIARNEILRRFEKWLDKRQDDETVTPENLVGGFAEMFPEVDAEEEAIASGRPAHPTCTGEQPLG